MFSYTVLDDYYSLHLKFKIIIYIPFCFLTKGDLGTVMRFTTNTIVNKLLNSIF
jgi:hypothetical protein